MADIDIGKLRIGTQLKKEAEEILRSAGVPPGSTVVDEKQLQPQRGDVPLVTNVYGILTNQQVKVFQYDIQISSVMNLRDGTTKLRELTKKDKNDAVLIDRRDRCRDVFNCLRSKETSFFRNAGCVYYDLQSIMYTLSPLDVPVGKEGRVFNIAATELSKEKEDKWSYFAGVEIEIRNVNDKGVSVGDFGSLTKDLSQTDRSLAQFLDIATSQNVFLHGDKHLAFNCGTSYLLKPQKNGFHSNDEAFFRDNGSYLGIGAQKSVHYVEGPENVRGKNVALVVQTKKTPFHFTETVSDKAKNLIRNVDNASSNDVTKLSRFFAGLQVETRHGSINQRFIVNGVESTNARDKTFEHEGRSLSVEQYFKTRYNIRLQHPTMPLLRARGKDGKFNYFPMEVCYVTDSQRVKTNQQTPKQVQEMIKKCAIPPANLKEQNNKTFLSLGLLEGTQLTSAGAKLIDHPFNLNGKALPPPDFQYGKNFVARHNPNNFTWQGREFLIPSSCKKWAAFAFLTPRDRLDPNDFKNWLGRYVQEAKQHGMSMPPPTHFETLTSGTGALRDRVSKAKQNGCDFVLIVHPDVADELHNGLKLYELEFGIVTQAVRYMTLVNMIQKGQRQTLENIVNKTNIKLGGLNYSLSINSPDTREVLGNDTLYIGFGLNHPGGGLGMGTESLSGSGSSGDNDPKKPQAPSIVGYTANVGLEHEFEFIGDFVFQEPLRDEKVEVIREVFGRCLEKYRTNRKSEPRRIIIYRNGCSEGQYSSILKYEVPLIKLALNQARCNAVLNIVVANKLQNIRFFAKQIDTRARASDQNIKPGTVVDHSITHPIFNEFFLNSHRALQGTARTPKYTVLVNESNLRLDQYERITYQLCYGHQIVYMPTSLPSPVYIANRYAERGRKLYQRWLEEARLGGANVNDYNVVTQKLGYYGHKELENRRINA